MPDLNHHPLVADRLAKLRSIDCPPHEFRRHVADIARLLVLPATAKLGTSDISVTTPITEMTGQRLARPIVLVPILRAGLGISDAFHQLLPKPPSPTMASLETKRPSNPRSTSSASPTTLTKPKSSSSTPCSPPEAAPPPLSKS